MALVREDVAVAADQRMDSEFEGMGLRLRKTKTGANQFVMVEREPVQGLLADLLAETRPG